MKYLDREIKAELFKYFLPNKVLGFIGSDWLQDKMGSPYQVEWAEVDGGSGTLYLKTNFGTTFSIKDTKTGATIEEKKGIEMGYSFTGDKIVTLGNQRVFYCDPIMMENSTTSITFRCD